MITASRLFLAGAVASIAGAASAESAFESTFTLGYSNSSSDLGDYSSVSLGIANEIRLNNITIDADIDFARLDPDGTSADVDLKRFALAPRYHFANGLVLGAYFQRVSAELDNAGFLTGVDGDADSYGLIFGYKDEKLTVEGFIGETETDPDIPNTDITDFGITADYDASDRLSVAGLFARTTIDAPGGEADADAIGVAASYDVTPEFQVFGGYGNFDVSDADLDGDSVAIGVG
ncbi:porin, partial [Rhodosalinus sp.]|uniref:porin n=1 Tax=Rhodosalinus sp. TaxID=2047741 RepID=UPI003978C781